jgi:hypothetical protein
VEDGLLIEEIDGGHDAILEFPFRRDADVAQDGAGELGEEALDEIEPGAVGVKVNSKRCAGWLASQALVSLE